MWSEALRGLDHASRASELAPIGGGCCLADCHSLRRLHPMTGFFRRPSIRRQGEPGFLTAGGSASPKGEARRERAGKAERSECRAREDYGWGWAGRCNRAVPRSPPKTCPKTPAAAQAARRHPPPTSPNTRGSASPKGEARRECAGKAEQSERRAREDDGWGWAGRFNQTVPASPPKTRPPSTLASRAVRRSPVSRFFPRPGAYAQSLFRTMKVFMPSSRSNVVR